MRAEMRGFMSNEVLDDWDHWEPSDPTNELHWFSVDIGPVDDPGAAIFHVAVATRRAIRNRSDKRSPFKGLYLDPFEKNQIEPLIREFVASARGETWEEIVEQLRAKMISEYD